MRSDATDNTVVLHNLSFSELLSGHREKQGSDEERGCRPFHKVADIEAGGPVFRVDATPEPHDHVGQRIVQNNVAEWMR